MLALPSSSSLCVRARARGALNARNRLVREPGFAPIVELVLMNSPGHFEIRHAILVSAKVEVSVGKYFELKRLVINGHERTSLTEGTQ